MSAERANGHCKDQVGGCMEHQLLEARVVVMEKTVRTIKIQFWAIIVLLITILGTIVGTVKAG